MKKSTPWYVAAFGTKRNALLAALAASSLLLLVTVVARQQTSDLPSLEAAITQQNRNFTYIKVPSEDGGNYTVWMVPGRVVLATKQFGNGSGLKGTTQELYEYWFNRANSSVHVHRVSNTPKSDGSGGVTQVNLRIYRSKDPAGFAAHMGDMIAFIEMVRDRETDAKSKQYLDGIVTNLKKVPLK